MGEKHLIIKYTFKILAFFNIFLQIVGFKLCQNLSLTNLKSTANESTNKIEQFIESRRTNAVGELRLA